MLSFGAEQQQAYAAPAEGRRGEWGVPKDSSLPPPCAIPTTLQLFMKKAPHTKFSPPPLRTTQLFEEVPI